MAKKKLTKAQAVEIGRQLYEWAKFSETRAGHLLRMVCVTYQESQATKAEAHRMIMTLLPAAKRAGFKPGGA